MNAVLRAVEIAGSRRALARAMGGKVRQQHVSYWVENGAPPGRVLGIYRATGGQVTPHELRPDIYPDPSFRPALEAPQAPAIPKAA